MIDLSVRGLVKGFEQGNDILKGITFDVNAGERVGILGRNGCGKTTFFRILSGELQPDAGTVSIASGRRLGLISQIPVYPDGWTTEDVLREAHRRLYDMEARMNELTARMATDDSPPCSRSTTACRKISAVSAGTTWSTSATASPTVWTSRPRCARSRSTVSPAGRKRA